MTPVLQVPKARRAILVRRVLPALRAKPVPRGLKASLDPQDRKGFRGIKVLRASQAPKVLLGQLDHKAPKVTPVRASICSERYLP